MEIQIVPVNKLITLRYSKKFNDYRVSQKPKYEINVLFKIFFRLVVLPLVKRMHIRKNNK